MIRKSVLIIKCIWRYLVVVVRGGDNKCLKKAEVLYDLYKVRGVSGDMKINILLIGHDGDISKGHAWLAVDGKSVMRRKTIATKIVMIGNNDKYNYWIAS